MMPGEPSVADSIANVLGVLPPIDLNDETPLAANKIDSVWPDRLLPNEFESIQASRSQFLPKCSLGICCYLAQASGAACLEFVSTAHSYSPSPGSHPMMRSVLSARALLVATPHAGRGEPSLAAA
jgi:hypothetical protein